MGQVNSIDQDPKVRAAVKKLSKLEVTDIEGVFLELSTKTQEGQSVIKQPTWLNRNKFAEIFGTTELFVEQLFEAFDQDKNGVIDLEEFISGMALVLHGSVKDKCLLLFKIFNLNGDDGISKDELSTVLTSCLQSARTVLLSTLKSEGFKEYQQISANQSEEAIMVSVVVDKIVKDAFEKCDVSKTGKLEIDEFIRWVQRNHKLVNNFILQCPKPSSGSPTTSATDSSTPHISQSPSLFSIIDTPETELPENEVFEITKTEKPTLLKMASMTDMNKPSVQDLFSQPSQQSNENNFFDSITNTNSDSGLDASLPRPSSQVFSAHPFKSTIEPSLGGSQKSLDNIPQNQNLLASHLQSDFSGSLQSIALSRDDLDKEATISSVESSHTTQEENEEPPVWHPLQEGHQNPDISIDLSQSSVDQPTTESPEMASEKISEKLEGDSEFNETPSNPDIDVKQGVSVEVLQDVSKQEVNSVEEDTTLERQLSNPLVEHALEEESKSNENPTLHFWQPSVTTQNILNGLQQGHQVDTSKMTFPSVLVEGVMGDPVRDLVIKYLGEQEALKRTVSNFNNTTTDVNENALKQLLVEGRWRAAIDWTTMYLTQYGQGLASVVTKERTLLTPVLMQVWFVRIALLVKLRMFSSAEAELNAFNDFDAPDMYYEFYPEIYPGKTGSIIPFSFRLLHAELPQHNGRPNVALDRLYILLYKVNRVITNLSNGLNENGSQKCDTQQESLSIWEKRRLRIHYSLGNCFFGMKEYTLAVKLYEKIIDYEPDKKEAVLSAIGRIYLQFGDVKSASKYFKQVENIAGSTSSKVLMNRGYHYLAQSQYEEAHQQFVAAISTDTENLAAYNNAAVCLLFLGRVKDASNILESMVMRSPKHGLHEEILFNLNTIYELETSRALQKKHKLLDMVNKYKGDGFNVQCLKLT